MNMLLMFIPILIVLLLVAGVGTIMIKASRRIRVSPKKTRWVIGGYILFLLAAAVLSVSVLSDKNTEFKTWSAEELEGIENKQMRVMDAAHSGRLEKVDDVYSNKKSWSFPYTDQQLDITHLDGEASEVFVFVEEKDTDDDVIEAIHYTGNVFVDGMDMTDKKSSAELELKGKILSVKAPEMVSVSVTRFSSGFPFQQFSNGKSWFLGERPSMGHGPDFILLRVPADVKVEGQTNYVRAQ